MPSRAILFEGMPMISVPLRRIEPRRWPMMPMIDLSVVVLPAPLRPSSVTTSPSATAKLIPCRMCDSPYQACSSSTRSSSRAEGDASGMTGPEIGLDDLGIVRHGGVIAFGQDATAGQHRDHVREIGNHGQIVLDRSEERRVGK